MGNERWTLKTHHLSLPVGPRGFENPSLEMKNVHTDVCVKRQSRRDAPIPRGWRVPAWGQDSATRVCWEGRRWKLRAGRTMEAVLSASHEREMQSLSVRRKLLAHPFSATMLAPPGAAFMAHLVLPGHWQTERL